MTGLKLHRWLAGSLLLVSISPFLVHSQPPATLATIRAAFLDPPDDARIMMRWWWFGPAVNHDELERELRLMKSADIGGVEIQPVYPLELDDPQKGFSNFPYGSPQFYDAITFVAGKAAELRMRVDVTLGSGWPYGGPHTPITEAAGRLRIERRTISGAAASAPIPPLENGEKLIAIFRVAGDGKGSLSAVTQLHEVENGRVRLSSDQNNPQTLLFFIASRTGQQVKRAAIGAEGFVLDHYNRAAIEHHLSTVANPLLQAFGSHPPTAVFSDSLEVFGTDWTDDFLEQFRARRGYDLTPHLPALAGDAGAETRAIRHDWGQTLTELAEERYLTPIRQWAHAHHTLFRSQTYGEPPVVLSSNSLVDLPEGEHGPEWRSFSAARWASSAGHLYGRPVISTETWTWLHAPSFRATPLDMKAEADLHFIEGINQLVGHGWPYSPPSAGEPGWRFYAAAAFNDHNPWFQVMPEITRYLQRVSYLLRQGTPANDIALYLPTDDAWAGFTPGTASVDQSMDRLLGPLVIPQILNAGFNFDFIDDPAIASRGVPYKLVILPGVERISFSTLQRLQAFVRSGGYLIATRRLPSLAPGFLNAETDSARIAEVARTLASEKNARFLPDEQMLGSTLAQMLPADCATGSAAPAIGFVHRKLTGADIYFIANTSNHEVDTQATIRLAHHNAAWWDPFTGDIKPAESQSNGDVTMLPLELAPYESRILVFSKDAQPERPTRSSRQVASIDLSSGWNVTFTTLKRTVSMDHLHSWTEDEATRYYSGEAIYQKDVTLPASFATSHPAAMLDFGPGELVPPPVGETLGMRALLESPIRESAVIYIDGQRAGSVWHPPYRIEVTRFLRAGSNHLRLVVANLAINEMAEQALPDYRLLNLRYGTRFVPQGFENLQPLPAGILGNVHLLLEN